MVDHATVIALTEQVERNRETIHVLCEQVAELSARLAQATQVEHILHRVHVRDLSIRN